MKTTLFENVTFGDKYGPAMEITNEAVAAAYFEQLVAHCMLFGGSREECERIERTNLGYWAGYYSNATRARVERLFKCAHPVFGPIAEKGPPTMEEAFQAGVEMATKRGADDPPAG